MNSCQGCQQWRLWLQQPENVVKDLTLSKGLHQKWWIHDTAFSFIQAVRAGCKLCALMRATALKRVTDQEILELDSRFSYIHQREAKIDDDPSSTHRGFALVVLYKRLQDFSEPFYLSFKVELLSSETFLRFDPSSSFPLSFPTTDRPNVPRDLAFLKTQISSCEKEHQDCVSNLSSSYTPTRLLYVGTQEAPRLNLQLWKDRDANSRPYVTLSHSWGGQLPFKLQEDNVAEFVKQIPESGLPKTFREAVYVTRYFGIEYLWIDALCIVQDNVEDWKRESAQMSQVYQNSHFTIAASHAKDSSGGLFTDSCGLDLDVTVDIWQPPGRMHPFVLHHTNYSRDVLDDEPLYRRGWVVQERFLSRRILHFTTHQVAWECCESFVCQNYPMGLPPSTQPFPRINCGGQSMSEGEDGSSFVRWRDIIQHYSACDLTYPADKLVAIQGLVSYFQQEQIQSEFLHGLWVNDMVGELLWDIQESPQRMLSSAYRAPSWSWASMDVPVYFISSDKSDVPLAEIQTSTRMLMFDDTIVRPENTWIDVRGNLVELHIQKGLHDDGTLTTAHIAEWPSFRVLETEIRSYVEGLQEEQLPNYVSYSETMVDLCRCAAGINISFDSQESFNDLANTQMTTSSAWFLPLRFCKNGDSFGLLIRHAAGTSDNIFYRLGCVSLRCGDEYDEGPSDGEDLTKEIMKMFLLGELPFQKRQPEIFAKKDIRLI